MAYNPQSSRQNKQAPAKHSGSSGSSGAIMLGMIFLGICILIAGLNIGGNLKKLNASIAEKNFSDSNTYNSPSDLTVGQKKYLNEKEAAAYLNMTEAEILSLFTTGEITEFVRTGTGYSVSTAVLDSWFDNEAYQNKLGQPAPASPEQ